MKQELLEKYLNYSLDTGASFADIYHEKNIIKSYIYLDNKIDNIRCTHDEGMGLRISDGKKIYYASINELNNKNIINVIDNLKSNINKSKTISVKLTKNNIKSQRVKIKHDDFSDEDKKKLLNKINKIARDHSDKIIQVRINLYEEDKDITVASSFGKYSKEKRTYTRIYISVVVNDNNKICDNGIQYGATKGYEIIDNINFEEDIKKTVDVALEKTTAIPCPGGKMPVVIGKGFGAVIFHEAFGHATEATSVAKNSSVLNGLLGKKIASDKVSIVDDGTIPYLWGTTIMDDEGNETRKNILLDKGILNSYLVDELNSKIMNHGITGSARKNDYSYKPTSRMNNTFLLPSNDKVDDMIKSIKYGLYAEKMGGGCVNPISGEFNFSVSVGYMIRDGKIAEMVSSASLIGSTLDILNQIEMISDDLEYGVGDCGSESGWVHVTIGQPTIKVSSITVGGV